MWNIRAARLSYHVCCFSYGNIIVNKALYKLIGVSAWCVERRDVKPHQINPCGTTLTSLYFASTLLKSVLPF